MWARGACELLELEDRLAHELPRARAGIFGDEVRHPKAALEIGITWGQAVTAIAVLSSMT